jgi:hypothetical protein
MKTSSRLSLLVLIVVFSSIAFASTPKAAGGAGGGSGNLPAGSYHFTTIRASYNFFGAYPAPQININVSKSNQVSTPRVGPSTVTAETDVFVQVSSYTVNVSGCFMLVNSTDFSVGSSLQTASLHTAIDSSTPGCSGYFNYVPTPFTLDVIWTGIGPIATARGNTSYACATYHSESITAGSSNLANATAALAPLFPDPFTVSGQAGLNSNDQSIHAEGISPDACQPAFGGKGAGRGFQPAGSYHSTTLQAGSNFSDSAGDHIGIFVSSGTQTSRPVGGASTTTPETNVIVQIFGGGTFGVACYIVAPADFSFSGVQAAALHTQLTTATRTCPNGPAFGTVPLPLNLDVTWTGAGPVTTVRSASQYSCMNYHTESVNSVDTNNAGTAATVTPLSTGTLTGTFGSLVNGDLHTDAAGVLDQTCVVRG